MALESAEEFAERVPKEVRYCDFNSITAKVHLRLAVHARDAALRGAAWVRCADGLPPDGTFCAVEFDDGSIGAAIAHSDWEYKFFDRRKYVGKNGKRMREDFELAGRPVRYMVIPAPPAAP